MFESSGVNTYRLANWLISLRFVSLKLLHSVPKCLSTDSTKSSAFSALVLVQRICVKIALNVVKASKLVQMKLIT